MESGFYIDGKRASIYNAKDLIERHATDLHGNGLEMYGECIAAWAELAEEGMTDVRVGHRVMCIESVGMIFRRFSAQLRDDYANAAEDDDALWSDWAIAGL